MAKPHPLALNQDPRHRTCVGAMGGDHLAIGQFDIGEEAFVALDQNPLLQRLVVEKGSAEGRTTGHGGGQGMSMVHCCGPHNAAQLWSRDGAFT